MARLSSPTPTKILLSPSWLWPGEPANMSSTRRGKGTSKMPNESISRRDILRTLAVGAVSGSVLQIIPAEAAAYVHQMVHKEKSATPAGNYSPKYFSAP